jgi:hypothetical protein
MTTSVTSEVGFLCGRADTVCRLQGPSRRPPSPPEHTGPERDPVNPEMPEPMGPAERPTHALPASRPSARGHAAPAAPQLSIYSYAPPAKDRSAESTGTGSQEGHEYFPEYHRGSVPVPVPVPGTAAHRMPPSLTHARGPLPAPTMVYGPKPSPHGRVGGNGTSLHAGGPPAGARGSQPSLVAPRHYHPSGGYEPDYEYEFSMDPGRRSPPSHPHLPSGPAPCECCSGGHQAWRPHHHHHPSYSHSPTSHSPPRAHVPVPVPAHEAAQTRKLHGPMPRPPGGMYDYHQPPIYPPAPRPVGGVGVGVGAPHMQPPQARKTPAMPPTRMMVAPPPVGNGHGNGESPRGTIFLQIDCR